MAIGRSGPEGEVCGLADNVTIGVPLRAWGAVRMRTCTRAQVARAVEKCFQKACRTQP